MRASLSLVAAAVLAVAAASAAVAERQDGSPEAAGAGPESADAAAKDTEPPVVHPEFKPSTRKALFLEQFLDDWVKRWSPSEATKKAVGEDSGKADPDLWRYRGKWEVEEATVYPGLKHDRGLVLKSAAALHAISAPFDAPIDPAGKDFVVQYEVKMQQGLECGGAYLKLLQANDAESFQAKEFTNETPYTLMFGPDKCGSTNKVQFIFRHKNPITGEYEEKHLESPPFARTDKLTTLYTLIVRPDNTYEIRVNDDKVSSGSLLENFKPPVNPPKEIVDSNDSKPVDWVDEARIPDPDAKKPDDWDEDAPFEILDVDAKKPDDWYEDEAETIPDPEAVKPDGWNDKEDGEWVPPMIPNPKCEKAAGCGKWSTPMKRNPAYKGKWKPPMIDNPAYKGVWKPRMVPNPDHFEDKNPANLSKMSGIGFELWTMQPDIMFDNIFIGHDIVEAEAFAEETWKVKYNIEKAEEKNALGQNTKTPQRGDQAPAVQFTKDPMAYIESNVFSAVSKIVGLPMEDLKAQRRYILAGAVSVAALIAALGYAALSNVLASRRTAGEAKKTDAVIAGEEEEEEEGQREAGAATAGEATAEAEAAENPKAKVVEAAEDATEAVVKKMEVQAGGSQTSGATLKNRASTAAAASADKSADKE